MPAKNSGSFPLGFSMAEPGTAIYSKQYLAELKRTALDRGDLSVGDLKGQSPFIRSARREDEWRKGTPPLPKGGDVSRLATDRGDIIPHPEFRIPNSGSAPSLYAPRIKQNLSYPAVNLVKFRKRKRILP